MKRKRILAFLTALLLLCSYTVVCAEEPEEPASGTVAKVTTPKGPLKMRAKASEKGRVICSVPNGTCLLVQEEDETWCLCQWDGKTGYCSTEYLTMLREADHSILGYRILREGDKGEDVLALKQRLQNLGYIRSGAARSPVLSEGNGLRKEICGCCMGEGCECCGITFQISGSGNVTILLKLPRNMPGQKQRRIYL